MQEFLQKYHLHQNFPVRNFDWILELAQGNSSSLYGVSEIMDILRCVESGLVLKPFPDTKVHVMSIKKSPTNNNLFVIGRIDFNDRVFKHP